MIYASDFGTTQIHAPMKPPSLREAPLTFRSSLDEGHAERTHDTLNLLPYAEALRDFVHECDTPMTIGIQGDWGSGKTSLMNMLRGTAEHPESGLLQDARCQVVNFETWPYAQFHRGTELVIACLAALTRGVGEQLADEAIDAANLDAALSSANHTLRQATARLGAGPATSGAAPDGGDGDISSLMLVFRSNFARLVDCWVGEDEARRVVVFIDDLDRVRPAEALLLLESLKNFLEVPGCVYVLALDYAVVQQGMAEKLGRDVQRTSGKAFYDKIIQLPFVMPTANYRLERYLVGLMEHSGFPFAEQLAGDRACREFFVGITQCTVGRNPRNIKRVLTYASLLERVRARQGSGEFDPRDAQILFALVCMQIAWPELFMHFVHDPTVDTVTSLQNWDYLESLPEARSILEREADPERLKLNITTFFDRLFSLLDENGDGQIDTRELEPVQNVMNLACMTSVETRERPRDWFIRRVRENNADRNPLIETFLDKVFTRSVWYLGSDCRYRRSGERYVTLVHQGRQIGSLVTLPNQPFVFRLALAPEQVRAGLKAYWSGKKSIKNEAITLTRSVFGKEASLTGFGDTVVDYSKMTNMSSDDAIGLLNALFRIAIGDELPEWELDGRAGKKK